MKAKSIMLKGRYIPLNLPNITLIAVTSVRVKEAIWALRYSCKNIRFAQVILLTDVAVSDVDFKTIRIPRLDYEGYSRFVVYELHKYFTTDFALLIQDDGYVVNPAMWDAQFLNYDYIGAPWEVPLDDFTYRDHLGTLRRIGNGGFSLRSRKLCRLAGELSLPWEEYHGSYHEDGFICTKNVHIYESHGCSFAPLDVAIRFSQEAAIPEADGIVPFGFHGKQSKFNVSYNRMVSRTGRIVGRVLNKVANRL